MTDEEIYRAVVDSKADETLTATFRYVAGTYELTPTQVQAAYYRYRNTGAKVSVDKGVDSRGSETPSNETEASQEGNTLSELIDTLTEASTQLGYQANYVIRLAAEVDARARMLDRNDKRIDFFNKYLD